MTAQGTAGFMRQLMQNLHNLATVWEHQHNYNKVKDAGYNYTVRYAAN